MARYSRGSWGDDFGGYPPYVPVAQRKKKAAQAAATLAKKGQKVSPVQIEGRTIARTFWGKAWCDNLESYSDFENRLPRGRSYVRNGSVVDLQITTGKVTALVQGSSMYKVNIAIQPVEAARWTSVVGECSGKIDSVVELLAGKLSGGVMEVITRKGAGLFPVPAHIHMKCSCPDYATLCKHVAAVLYGVGARLDQRPELLFELRSADPTQLVSVAAAGGILRGGKGAEKGKSLGSADLSSVFGIDIEDGAVEVAPVAVKPVKAAPRAAVKAAPAAVAKAAPLQWRLRRECCEGCAAGCGEGCACGSGEGCAAGCREGCAAGCGEAESVEIHRGPGRGRDGGTTAGEGARRGSGGPRADRRAGQERGVKHHTTCSGACGAARVGWGPRRLAGGAGRRVPPRDG